MNREKIEQSFLWNLISTIQEHFKNKSLKTHYFKDFSRTTYYSRTIQGIQEMLATLAKFHGPFRFSNLIQLLNNQLLQDSIISFLGIGE